MIDLHCHMLPGIDDGAPDLETALAMAQAAIDDGIKVTACTPHIYPGLFDNTIEDIEAAVAAFRQELDRAGLPLEVTHAADIQITPELVDGLRARRLPTFNGGRYFLFEPPHHIAPPGLLNLVHSVLAAGYVPIMTHPERLSYVDSYYDEFRRAVDMGAWMQITGGAVTGRFGNRVQAVAQRFLGDGLVHLLASDGHNLKKRRPVLSEARVAAAEWVGEEESWRLVRDRPRAILDDIPPEQVAPPEVAPPASAQQASKGFFARLLS